MWFFIFTILSSYIDSPYFDFYIKTSNNMSYTIEEDYIEVDLYLDLIVYLEYDAYIIYDEDIVKHYDIELTLPVPEPFDPSEVGKIITYVVWSSFEVVITQDSSTINYSFDVLSTILGQQDEYLTGTQTHIDGNMYIERGAEESLPFYIVVDEVQPYEIQHDIRGFTANEIYQEGYNDGYQDGEEEGYMNGYFDGYSEGEYNGSMTQPIFKLFNAVFRVIDNVLSVEILPGIKIWYVLGVPFVFLIIQFFINLWR